MITDAAEHFINELTIKTTNAEIEWKPLCEFYADSNGFPDFMDQVFEILDCSEYRMIQQKNSFFFYHNRGVVSLIRIESYSGKDGSHHTDYFIVLQIRENYPVYSLCTGLFQDELEILYMAVLDYLNRDISLPGDLYEFMRF